jgi:hypothetical protein
MPLPINKIPPGLLSYMGIKNGGRNPQWPDDPVLVPVIDLLKWTQADDFGAFTQNANTAAVATTGAINAVSVPAGQVWMITNVAANVGAMGAGATLEYALAIGYQVAGAATTQWEPIGPSSGVLTVGLSGSAGRFEPSTPLILRPAMSLGIWVKQFAGAPGPVSIQFRGLSLMI